MAVAAIAGAVGAGSSLMTGISDTVLGVQHLNLQKEQLELSKQALQQNKDLTLASMALTAQMPYIEAKAAAKGQVAVMQAKYDFYKNNGADENSLFALASGKTLFSTGKERVATVHKTVIDHINPMPGSHTNTPILMDVTKRRKTSTVSTQAGNPNVGEQPARGTQTPSNIVRVTGSTQTSGSIRVRETPMTSNASTQVGFQFVWPDRLNKKQTGTVGPRSENSGTQTDPTQTFTPRLRLPRANFVQQQATREIAFKGVGINNAVKTFYRDALMAKKTQL